MTKSLYLTSFLFLACGEAHEPAPAVPPPRVATEAEAVEPPASAARAGAEPRGMLEQTSAFFREAGYIARGEPVLESLEADTSTEHPLHVEAHECIAPVAIGELPSQLELSLVDGDRVLARNTGPHPMLWYCSAVARNLTVRVSAGPSAASYRYGVWAARDDVDLSTLRAFAGGDCVAYPGRDPVFPDGGFEEWSWVGADEGISVAGWLPRRRDGALEAVLGVATDDARVLRHEGAIVWLDLRDASARALLSDVAGPVTLVVDEATLTDASTDGRTGRTLLEDLVTVTSCQSVALTLVVEADGGVGAVDEVLRLARLRGLHWAHVGEGRVPLPSEVAGSLRALEGLARLSFEGVELDATGWVESLPFLQAFADTSGATWSDEELASIARVPRLGALFIRAGALSAAGLAPLRALSSEQLTDASLRGGETERYRVGLPHFVFGPGAAMDPASADPLLRALLEDRAGDDFFVLEDDVGDEGEPRYVRRVTRRCGAAARDAIRALGDEWRCGSTRCGPADGCPGNGCEAVSFDGGVPLSHWRGVLDDDLPAAADGLTPAQARRLRRDLACDGTTRLEARFF